MVTMRTIVAFAVFAVCGFGILADPPSAKKDPRKHLPPEIVAAWKKAGAEVGWMPVDEFRMTLFRPANAGVAGDLPAMSFSYPSYKEGVLANLPIPADAFGLDFTSTLLTDAGLKELARLKSLGVLNLRQTQVTDRGLKELTRLKNLKSLHLDATKVTDAGLKELAGCKSLQTLNLAETKVAG